MEFNFLPYAVGGATRPDAFSGLRPEMQSALAAMLQAAEVELEPGALRITSAYRSPEKQAELYAAAVAKYGSEEAARRWVAPPGRSQHNFGTAVDFGDGNGGLLRDPNSRSAAWLRDNAGRFGLDVPMSWEPWQVELAGARGNGTAATTPGPAYTGAPVQEPPQNALASMAGPGDVQRPRMALQDMTQDPAAFMTDASAFSRNALAFYGPQDRRFG